MPTASLLDFINTPLNDVHARKLTEHFGSRIVSGVSLPSDLSAVRVVFICFTNRCGSNYLAEILATSGQFNLGGEVFNFDTVINQSKEFGYESFDEYLIGLMRRTKRGGNFVAKIASSQLLHLHQLGIRSRLFENARYIVLERGDKLSQAISLQIAAKTKRWTSYMEGEDGPENVKLNREAVSTILENIAQEYRRFSLIFSILGIRPCLMSYENLWRRPVFIAKAALRDLGFDNYEFDIAAVRTQRQRGPVNEGLRKVYLRYLAQASDNAGGT